MTAAVWLVLLSHWRRQKLQLATLLAGLALATGLWSAVQAINAEARASYAAAARQLGTAAGPALVPRAGQSIALARYVALRRAGWQLAPLLEGRTRLGRERVTVTGVDFLTYPVLPALNPQGGGATPAELLAAPGRLFARPETAARIAAAPDLPPVIETDQVPPGTVLTDIGVAERLLGRTGQISRLLVLPDQPVGLVPLDQLAPDLILQPARDGDGAGRLTESFELNLSAFGLLAFAVGLFIVHGTAGLAFEQRRGMVRTLRALGLPLRRLTALMLAELLALALIGGALGLGLGYLVAAALLPDVAATLHGLYGAPMDGALTLRPQWAAAGLGMSVLGALVASAQGLWRLRRLPLLSAPGPRAWGSAAARAAAGQAGAGLVLAGLGGLAIWLFDGLVAGFALLAGLMLGAALMLPPLLGLALRLGGRRARQPVAQWLWADMRAQLPGLSLALMALLLALAANIGVGTMVASFRLTFTGWLDQRLASELYVTATSDAQSAAMRDWLAPRSDAVLPMRTAETTLAGMPANILGLADHPTYRDAWPLLSAAPGAWDRLARGEAALVSEQLARRAGLWPGSMIALAPGWILPVAGVYADYGNPLGQAVVSAGALQARFPTLPDRQFAVRVDPVRAPALARALQDRFDLPSTAVVDQAAIKAQSLDIFEKTFVVTGALNILTLGVAGFAILTSLLSLWSMRLPQLAPVWALGLTRARLARLELLRAVLLAAMTAVLALPLGLGLAWVLLAVINVEAFGWRLPLYLFPADWLRLLGLALLAAAVAAALPARRLRHVPPADLLKVFANER